MRTTQNTSCSACNLQTSLVSGICELGRPLKPAGRTPNHCHGTAPWLLAIAYCLLSSEKRVVCSRSFRKVFYVYGNLDGFHIAAYAVWITRTETAYLSQPVVIWKVSAVEEAELYVWSRPILTFTH